jgi:hypothetical protein
VQDLKTMPALKANEFKVGYAASAMPVRYAMERRQWTEAAQFDPIVGAQPQVSAITIWARAVGLARSGKPDAARPDIDLLKQARETLRAAGDDYWAVQVHVLYNETLGWIAHAAGKQNDAIQFLRAAADEEDSVEKRPVTPGAIIPAREQLGDLLLELNVPEAALPEFERVLTTSPGRHNSVLGRDRAREIINTLGKGEKD